MSSYDSDSNRNSKGNDNATSAPLTSYCGVNQTFTFANIMGQGRVNQLGGVFINGRPLPPHIRLKIIEMATNGIKPCQISRQLRVSHGCVSKILYRYAETGSIAPGQIGGNPRSKKAISIAEEHIHELKQKRPELSASELRILLINKRICSRTNAPTVALITRLLNAKSQKTTESPQCIKHSVMRILNEKNESKSLYEAPIFEHRRSRTSFTPDQLEILEQAFAANTYPDAQQRSIIAQKSGLSEGKIQVWFSNRRARCRKSLNSTAFHPLMLPPLPFATNEIPSIFTPMQNDTSALLFYPSPLVNPITSTCIPHLQLSKSTI